MANTASDRSRQQSSSPGVLAPEVLEREDLRLALEEHDFGAAFALMKKWGGLSQSRIAFACELTPGKVSTIVSGRHRITSVEVMRRISDGLHIPGHMLGLAPRPWEMDRAPDGGAASAAMTASADAVPWQPDATADMAIELTRSDLVMDRRAITRALAGAAATGPALLEALEGWQIPAVADSRRRRPGRLGAGEVAELEATARIFRSWGQQHGGGFRRKAVVGLLSEVSSAVDQAQRPDIERRLYSVMAQLAGVVATMFWDVGQQRRAQDYYRLALRVAHAGKDTAFGANILAGMARQMLYCDRPDDARELVRLAQDGSQNVAGPRLRAMLHTREAWAYANMGRVSAFRRATDQAQEELSRAENPEQEPYWIRYFTGAELSGVTGGRLLDMARKNPREHAEDASTHIRQALSQRGPEAGRGHVLDRIGLAECSFLTGDLKEACEQTYRAMETAAQTRSERVRSQLSQLYPYTVGHGASRHVIEARASIRSLLADGPREAT